MSIEIDIATDSSHWNDLVERSPHGTPFHLWEFCECAADHAAAEFYPLVGYKGQEPVGLFPAFEIRKGPLTVVLSPPPALKISYGGPVLLNQAKLKQRKAERRHRRFVDGVFEWLDREVAPSYVHVRTGPRYDDPRPFVWRSFDVSPGYTYVVDLTGGEEAMLDRFSRDARQNVTGTYDGVGLFEGGPTDTRAILQQVRTRHEDQGEPFDVPDEFVTALVERLPAGTLRSYVCTADGAFLGGMNTLELGDTVYRWLGGAKQDCEPPVNDLLDWRIMRDAVRRGATRYDLVGAQTPRICSYKAKFAPELAAYQQLEGGSLAMRLALRVYKRVRA